ncbi:MAG: hypothetical protein IPP55_05910 [Anaerolineales bacterium]|nr:hypothetical protein [Anaerolineales bacterium]
MDVTIRTVTKAGRDEWFKMRKGICPEAPDEYLLSDMDVILASEENAVFVAIVDGTDDRGVFTGLW